MQPSFKEIVEEIVANHHSFLRKELPKISELLEALADDCSPSDALIEAQKLYKKVRSKIETHLKDEETLLFPTGIALESEDVAPVTEMNLLERLHEMEVEHDGCGNALTTLSQMIATLPNKEQTEQVISKIKSVQKDLAIHVEKENTLVHPRFLELFEARSSARCS
ncbi:MAG: hemerythrin domain-containing protein [Candidatus Obscuribacterales bacterium]|nr:hemerythrin domain-containing protein [Candidatus Obscuribacterales bacterium]